MKVAQASSHPPNTIPEQLWPGHRPEFIGGTPERGQASLTPTHQALEHQLPDLGLARPCIGPRRVLRKSRAQLERLGLEPGQGTLDAGLCSNMWHLCISCSVFMISIELKAVLASIAWTSAQNFSRSMSGFLPQLLCLPPCESQSTLLKEGAWGDSLTHSPGVGSSSEHKSSVDDGVSPDSNP